MILPSPAPQQQSLKAYGFIKALLLSWLLFSAIVQARPAVDPVELAKQPYWLKLGHYLPRSLGGYRSTIDSAEFFLSAEGKTNPLAELKATLEQLYHSDPAVAERARLLIPPVIPGWKRKLVMSLN